MLPFKYEEPRTIDVLDIAVAYQVQRDLQLSGWSTTLSAKDIDVLWDLSCRAVEHALGLQVQSRGHLLLGDQQLLEPQPDQEWVDTAKQQNLCGILWVSGMSASHMKDVRISARKALGKGGSLGRCSPLEFMAYGGPDAGRL
eukprot:3496055-Amphidinium_carterae.1